MSKLGNRDLPVQMVEYENAAGEICKVLTYTGYISSGTQSVLYINGEKYTVKTNKDESLFNEILE